MKNSRKRRLIVFLLIASILLTACGGRNDPILTDTSGTGTESTGEGTFESGTLGEEETSSDTGTSGTDQPKPPVRDPEQIDNNGIIDYVAGEGLLYNGIRLPENWPPSNVDSTSDEVVQVPYLLSEGEGGYRPEVIDITVGRQLFVDNFLIESTDLSTVYHQAQKYEGNPILNPKTSSELTGGWGAGTSAGGIWYDMEDQKYKMWYDIAFNPMLGYAESDDGINWTRVETDVYTDSMGKPTNVVMSKDDKNGTCSVFIDYTADPSEKYKMLVHSLDDRVYHEDRDPNLNEDLGYDRLPGDVDENSYISTLFVSEDGLHWTKKDGHAIGASGDMTTAFYNEFTNKWVNSLRGYISGDRTDSDPTNDSNQRARWYAEHDSFEDLLSWSEDDVVFWLKTDEKDATASNGQNSQNYNFSAIAYESIMLGSYTVWYGPENHEIEISRNPKINEIQMAYSRDGFYFDRPDRTSFIGVGDDGDWDKGYLFSTIGGIIVKDDVLYIYYSGFSGYNSPIGTTFGEANPHGHQSIGLATLRRDGFASLEGKGSMTTRKLTANEGKKYLFVNIDTPDASFRAEVIDANGNVVEGFSMPSTSGESLLPTSPCRAGFSAVRNSSEG